MTVSEYNTCVEDHADGVYRFILKNVRHQERARDIVQDTFEKLWIRVAEIDSKKAKSYLFTAAYNTMINELRRDKFHADFEKVSEEDHRTSNSYSDLKDILNEALSKLNETQRSVILLRDYEGYSYEEIGSITGLSEPQVKTYIYRARVFLKEHIGSLDSVI